MAQPLIELRDIVKKYGTNYVLNGVNLSIYSGEITSIIGKSGVGKSVLLKHMIGLIEPDAGQILFDGKPIAEMKAAERRSMKRKFSYMFQDSALFDFLSVYENIALPLRERTSLPEAEINRRVHDKTHQLDLHKIDSKYPSQLSGGMKKRVALARALVTDPEVVLFDEPTTGLDPIRKNAVLSMISDYQKRFGFTGVVVSHEIPDIFFISQRVAMIDGGKILFEGTPEEIQHATDPVIRSFIQGLESPHDGLTGIASQIQGQNRFREEMLRLQRHQIPFSIVVLKIENIEGIDRISGHMAGQTILQRFANHVKQNIYITDTCFRYGMNMIIVVLPDTNAVQAKMFCDKLARQVEQMQLFDKDIDRGGVRFQVRAGIAQAQPDSRLELLLSQAESQSFDLHQCVM
jgi:phospholipid/cholesterol/gamma-HCH transport system ATP-binding protein